MEKCHEFINNIRERRHQKTMMRQIKKFEKLLMKTGGRSNMQSSRDGKNQDLNGTFETMQPFETTVETTQSSNRIEAVTSTTTIHNSNNKVKWVHNLSQDPPD